MSDRSSHVDSSERLSSAEDTLIDQESGGNHATSTDSVPNLHQSLHSTDEPTTNTSWATERQYDHTIPIPSLPPSPVPVPPEPWPYRPPSTQYASGKQFFRQPVRRPTHHVPEHATTGYAHSNLYYSPALVPQPLPATPPQQRYISMTPPTGAIALSPVRNLTPADSSFQNPTSYSGWVMPYSQLYSSPAPMSHLSLSDNQTIQPPSGQTPVTNPPAERSLPPSGSVAQPQTTDALPKDPYYHPSAPPQWQSYRPTPMTNASLQIPPVPHVYTPYPPTRSLSSPPPTYVNQTLSPRVADLSNPATRPSLINDLNIFVAKDPFRRHTHDKNDSWDFTFDEIQTADGPPGSSRKNTSAHQYTGQAQYSTYHAGVPNINHSTPLSTAVVNQQPPQIHVSPHVSPQAPVMHPQSLQQGVIPLPGPNEGSPTQATSTNAFPSESQPVVNVPETTPFEQSTSHKLHSELAGGTHPPKNRNPPSRPVSVHSLSPKPSLSNMQQPVSQPMDVSLNNAGQSPALYPVFSGTYPSPGSQPLPPISSPETRTSAMRFVADILLYILTEVYRHFLLRLPSLYLSRVARIFEQANLTLPEIKQMALEMSDVSSDDELHWVMLDSRNEFPPQYQRLKSAWEGFITSVMREWKTFNIISVILLSAILTVLQIPGAAFDPLTRFTALLSLICALISLLFGCMYIIRFGSMRRTYKAAEWALEAQKSTTSILWNVWILLAMPAIWLTWSLILYISCIMSFVWRLGPDDDSPRFKLTGACLLATRIVISAVLGLGIIYGVLISSTFRRYGPVMDMAWKRRIEGWMQEKTSRSFPQPGVYSNTQYWNPGSQPEQHSSYFHTDSSSPSGVQQGPASSPPGQASNVYDPASGNTSASYAISPLPIVSFINNLPLPEASHPAAQPC